MSMNMLCESESPVGNVLRKLPAGALVSVGLQRARFNMCKGAGKAAALKALGDVVDPAVLLLESFQNGNPWRTGTLERAWWNAGWQEGVEDGGRRAEDGGRRAEDGGRMSEVGGRRAEDGFVVMVGYPRNALAGKCLQGPREPKMVKKYGYGFTTERARMWTFPSMKAAEAKARIIDRHMGWGDGVMVAMPVAEIEERRTEVG